MIRDISLYVQALLYILAGLNHFRVPGLYEKIMPPYIPFAPGLVAISGGIEVVLGLIILFPQTRQPALVLIALMLVAYLPVHIYMLHIAPFRLGGMNVNIQAAWLRLLFQIPLILWALWQGNFLFTRTNS